MKNTQLKYNLNDIEIWFYDFVDFPILLSSKKYHDLINKKYTVSEFEKIESDLKNKIESNDYYIQETMNPLYPDSNSTVISFDVIKNEIENQTIKTTKNINIPNSINSILKSMEKYFIEYEKRLDTIMETGVGSLKMIKQNGYFLSEDELLNDLERKIAKITEKHFSIIIKFLEKGYSPNLFQALQWLPKKYKTINFLINKLETSQNDETNLILRQLIPLVSDLSKKQKENIAKIIETRLLILPSSCIRNKALCILITIIDDIPLSTKTINFIKTVSQTKQLNCSFPAKGIINTLSKH